MSEPLVGVIIPCFNQGRYAAECVASLRAQTWRNWRAVLVNDASTDNSAALLDALAGDRVEVVHLSRNLGRALVRNEAVRRLGTVDYVLNVDCDDRLTPPYIAQLLAALDANPRAGLAYGTLHYFGAPHHNTTWPTEPFDFALRYMENRIPGPGVLFRAEALAQTEGWRREFTNSSGEDWDIWLQVIDRGWQPLWVREAAYDYRQHEQSFLARSSEEMHATQDLMLLRLHARGIRKTCGLDAYLTPRVIPQLAAALRRGRGKRLAHMAVPLFRHVPLTALKLLSRHYLRRLRAILRR
jgi:glycosyltransferase involved in cell wall biosynthesis